MTSPTVDREPSFDQPDDRADRGRRFMQHVRDPLMRVAAFALGVKDEFVTDGGLTTREQAALANLAGAVADYIVEATPFSARDQWRLEPEALFQLERRS